jgi:hypothetical protein
LPVGNLVSFAEVIIQAHIGDHTSALMSAAQQIAISSGESSPMSCPSDEPMAKQAEACRS